MAEKKEFNPTPEQSAVITKPRSNILVSAAAGSGKTTVLAARIATEIVKNELEVDQLLVVTFTKDAAAHMREKIEESLHDALVKIPASKTDERKYLKSQIDKISGAYIQTMNSFCNRVVSESGHMSEDSDLMDPGSQVLDENTLKMLRVQAATDAVMSKYDGIADGTLPENEREDFLNLVFSTGDGKKEGPLVESLVTAYGKLRSLPDYLKIIDDVIEQREKFDKSGEIEGLKRYLELNEPLIEKGISSCDITEPKIDSLDIKDESKAILHEIVGWYRRHYDVYKRAVSAAVSDEDRFNAVREFYKGIYKDVDPSEYPYLHERNKEKDEDFLKEFGPVAMVCLINRENHKANGENVKTGQWGWGPSSQPYELNTDFDPMRRFSADELRARQLRRTSCARAFAVLLKDMETGYSKLKKSLHGIDYSDQEHMCLRVLETPEARDFYKNRFKEIYIDEYQDNTSLQDAVVEKIADNNVFCVGDVKQSIYRFRNANPSMFIRKADLYNSDESKGKLMTLNCNFRSTPQIIGFVNEIFGQLMSGDAAEIDYDGDNHQLAAFEKTPDGNIPEVIIINAKDKTKVGDDQSNGSSDSADSAAEEIKAMELLVSEIRKKVDEYIAEGYTYKDIFVLTRTNNAARTASDHLRSAGIPARCVDEKPLFADNEIVGLCNLIKVLANVYRDECLAGVMLSPYRFSNFRLDDIAEIVSFCPPEYKYMNLIVKVKYYIKEGKNEAIRNRCASLLNAIDDLRSESVIKDINELIESVYVRSGIKATLSAETPKEIEKLNVFKNWLCSVFLNRGSDLSEVADVIEKMQSRLDDKTAIEYDLGGEDLVRCMSYHKSKGLERKCVIVADVDTSNKKDTDPYISFKAGRVLSAEDPKGPRFVVDDYDDKNSLALTSPEKAVVKEEDKLETTAEDLRLLYVALTRAQENLCFIRRMNLESETLGPSVYTPLIAEEKGLSRDYYTRCAGIDKLMLTALLRMKLSDDSSDLKAECGITESFAYNSGFTGVSVTVKKAQDVVESSDDDSASADQDDKDVKEAGSETEDKTSEQEICGFVKWNDEEDRPEFEPYRFEDAINAPAKTSVSAMKRELDAVYSSESADEDTDENSDLNLGINLLVLDADHYLGKSGSMSAASMGTFVHKTMRFINLAKLSEGASASDELDVLLEEGILSVQERNAADQFGSHIGEFARSVLGKSLVNADKNGRALREKELTCAIRITPDRDDYKLVQGTLDAMYIDEDGSAVIIDYKTDYIETDDSDEIIRIVKERHGAQLELYAAAVEASGIKVKSRYVWLLRKDMAVEL